MPDIQKVVVVIPTYNERENLPLLIQSIFDLRIPELSLLIVDDSSPDGTSTVAYEFAKKYPIEILKRPHKEGIGRAYIAGFLKILKNTDIIIQMDADMSHDPLRIPAFLANLNQYDVVLGSRYIAGGGTQNWNYARRAISKFGNIFAKIVLGLPFSDLTGGYKCFRASALGKIDFQKISSLGYCFQIEMTYRMHKNGSRICEIPILFTERKTGISKFNIGIILESFWRVIQMRFYE